jgi:hypothetical protein
MQSKVENYCCERPSTQVELKDNIYKIKDWIETIKYCVECLWI